MTFSNTKFITHSDILHFELELIQYCRSSCDLCARCDGTFTPCQEVLFCDVCHIWVHDTQSDCESFVPPQFMTVKHLTVKCRQSELSSYQIYKQSVCELNMENIFCTFTQYINLVYEFDCELNCNGKELRLHEYTVPIINLLRNVLFVSDMYTLS